MKNKLFSIVSIMVFTIILCVGCSNADQIKEDIKNEVSNAINNMVNDALNELSGANIADYSNNDIYSVKDDVAVNNDNVEADNVVDEINTDPIIDDNDVVTSTVGPTSTSMPTATPTLAPTNTTTTVAPTLAPTNTPVPTVAPTSTLKPTPTQKVSKLRFRNWTLLDQHYEKHGIEMGFASAEEYEKAAAAVVTHPEVLHKTEAEDGDDVYYVESTNEFVIVSKDGYLRTYFNPSSGIKYYERQ